MPLGLIQDLIGSIFVRRILLGSSGVYCIPLPLEYGHTVTTWYHPNYPWGMIMRIINSLSPLDAVPEIKIIMLPFYYI